MPLRSAEASRQSTPMLVLNVAIVLLVAVHPVQTVAAADEVPWLAVLAGVLAAFVLGYALETGPGRRLWGSFERAGIDARALVLLCVVGVWLVVLAAVRPPAVPFAGGSLGLLGVLLVASVVELAGRSLAGWERRERPEPN